VTPVLAATNRPGARVAIGPWADMLTVSPDGKTVYMVATANGTVMPMAAASGVAGRPIKVARDPTAIVIAPDGRTAYVTGGSGTVTPIDVRTQTARAAIRIGGRRWPSWSRPEVAALRWLDGTG
jgi:DNA-binding beta-propeller fold protein YncE